MNKEKLEIIKGLVNNSLVCCHRVDYDLDKEEGKMYMGGIDGFFINPSMLKLFIQNDLVLGQCHWDFYLPYKILTVYRNIIFLKNRILFHKKHDLQYNKKDWEKTAEVFVKQENLIKFKNKPQHLINYVYRTFMGKSKTVLI